MKWSVGLLAWAIASQQPAGSIDPGHVPNHVGETITVCGTIVRVSCERPTGSIVFAFASDPSMHVAVFTGPVDRLLFEPRRQFVGREACATGSITASPPRPNAPLSYSVLVSTSDALQLVGTKEVPTAFGLDAADSCDAGVTPPKPLRREQPRYTREAQRAKIQGEVELEFVVLADGTVGDVRLIRSLDPGLDDEAILALKQWRFTPAVRDGQPVPFIYYTNFRFSIVSR